MSTLVAYYSRAGQNYGNGGIIDLPKGNTEVLAEAIAKELGASLFKIDTVEPYPANYYATTDQANASCVTRRVRQSRDRFHPWRAWTPSCSAIPTGGAPCPWRSRPSLTRSTLTA